MARTWEALPFARQAAFLGAVGISAHGRSQWDRWPELLGDDIYAAAMIAPDRRQLLHDVVATTRPPADFMGWVRMRSRWRAGERELAALGLRAPGVPGQRASLIRLLCTPASARGAWPFLAAKILGSFAPHELDAGWQPDRETTR